MQEKDVKTWFMEEYGKIISNFSNNFWEMGLFAAQNAYLCGFIQSVLIKKRQPWNGNRCLKSRNNYCQILVILLSPCVRSISYKLLLYRKVKLLPVALSYNKGEIAYPRNLSDDLIDKVFPSHEYNPNRKYLDENLNVRKMYML